MGTSASVAAIQEFIASQNIDKSNSSWRTKLPKPPQFEFAAGQKWHWKIETSVGSLMVRLLPDVAPMHVSSTAYLTLLGFYDDLSFHRVITSFMAQGGCPLGAGTGGPGYQYEGEFSPAQRHDRPGLLSMANAGPGTDGSQFFLTFVPTPWLDDKHSIFGEVEDGSGTLEELERRGSDSGRPSEPMAMVRSEILVS